ncbi:cache domain-containing protein [Lebetimonas sp. JS138]|uniref:cache domain-containing protein n=1 Tax=Lebetimonas sp. JS138 TaxID=990072 RepID=UPI000464F162|nr:cache domain-containing protein [Lebetimonas sp. JS138]
MNKCLNQNYIFAYDINGITKVHKLNSFLGRSIKTIYLSNHISFYEMSKKILQKSSEGFIEIKFFKPNHTNKKYLKIDFIKYIPELNLIIGSGEYVDEIKKKIENQIFQRVMIKKYGNNNYFFIIKKDGTLIINPTCKRKLGKIF